MDIQLRLQTALDDHRATRLSQAIAGYRDVLALEHGNATAQAMLGVALTQSGERNEGLRHVMRAVALEPGDAGLLENLGACLDQLGKRGAAGFTFMRSAALAVGTGSALAAAGACFIAMKALPRAIRCFRRALTLSPAEAKWWTVGGDAALDFGRPEAAISGFRRSLTLGLDESYVLDRLWDALVRMDHFDQGSAILELSAARLRASRWHHPQLAAGAGTASGSDSFLLTSEPKLRHDIQQFEYLIARGILPKRFADTIAKYRTLLAQSTGRAVDGPCYRMTDAERQTVGDTYNRVVHLHRTKVSGSSTLSADVDWAAAGKRYFDSTAGIVVIDDLLAPEVLAEVRRVCLESTIWFDDRHLGGYLGAMLWHGLSDSILLRISRDLAKRMPAIFRNYPLRQMWAYKYDSRLEGTALHADSAAINVNFWITPDEANLSKEHGGLVVYDRRAPAEWEFAKYNNDQPAIRQFLDESGAKRMVVPYRCNRAVIFHSDLFHRTDDLHFRDDYVSRRINVTMLFGDRGDV